jgi:ParB family chromosome partitioning protein
MPKVTTAKKPKKRKSKEAVPESRGLTAGRLAGSAPANVQKLAEQVEADGGSVIGMYRDPLGGNWQLLAGLPIGKVEPTPFQRDVSEAHAARLAAAIDKLDRFLDPLIAVPAEGRYWVPNGSHRLAAMRALGAKAVVALVAPEQRLAYRILALNTEKAHNLRERALEVIRMAEGLVALDDRPEREFQTEFEEPALITLGLCYQQRGRFSGSVYHSVLKRVEKFGAAKLSTALATRRERAAKLLELDDAVNAAVKALKDRGFTSPYLKAFVVARINPIRFQRKTSADVDDTIDKMLRSAQRFDATKVKAGQVASAGGALED